MEWDYKSMTRLMINMSKWRCDDLLWEEILPFIEYIISPGQYIRCFVDATLLMCTAINEYI